MAAVVMQRPFSCFTENRAPVSSIAVRPGSPQRRRRKVLARKPQPAAQRRDRVSTPCACEKRRVKVAQEGDGLGKAWKPRKSVWITAARRRADRPPGCAQPPEACVSRTRNGEEMGSPSGRACPGSAAQAAYRRAHMRHPKDRAGQASVGKRLGAWASGAGATRQRPKCDHGMYPGAAPGSKRPSTTSSTNPAKTAKSASRRSLMCGHHPESGSHTINRQSIEVPSRKEPCSDQRKHMRAPEERDERPSLDSSRAISTWCALTITKGIAVQKSSPAPASPSSVANPPWFSELIKRKNERESRIEGSYESRNRRALTSVRSM